jgi:hypothetical protein
MTLLSILLVTKSGEIQVANIKEFSEDDLYKRAGFKSGTDFSLRTIYRGGDGKDVYVYGKITGRAGQENKYEFPPPIDKMLFFGTVVLVTKADNVPVSSVLSEWEQMYDAFMGGFEDIGTEDSEVSTEEEEVGAMTKEGFVKDGFVVDDDDEEEKTKTKKPVKRIVPPKKKKEQVFADAVRALADEPPAALDCSLELTEEEYV